MAGAIFQIFAGVVAIVFGFAGGTFYPAFMRRPRPDEKHMPKWLGRTIFVVVGVVFILGTLRPAAPLAAPSKMSDSVDSEIPLAQVLVNALTGEVDFKCPITRQIRS